MKGVLKECKLEQQAPKSEHVGGDPRAADVHDHGGQRGSEASSPDPDFDASKAAESAGLNVFSGKESSLERMDSAREKGLSSEQMAVITGQLDELCSLCEANFKDMIWPQPRVLASQGIPAKACVEVFEISCGFSAFLGNDKKDPKSRSRPTGHPGCSRSFLHFGKSGQASTSTCVVESGV